MLSTFKNVNSSSYFNLLRLTCMRQKGPYILYLHTWKQEFLLHGDCTDSSTRGLNCVLNRRYSTLLIRDTKGWTYFSKAEHFVCHYFYNVLDLSVFQTPDVWMVWADESVMDNNECKSKPLNVARLQRQKASCWCCIDSCHWNYVAFSLSVWALAAVSYCELSFNGMFRLRMICACLLNDHRHIQWELRT